MIVIELQGNFAKPVGQKPIPTDPEFKIQHAAGGQYEHSERPHKKHGLERLKSKWIFSFDLQL